MSRETKKLVIPNDFRDALENILKGRPISKRGDDLSTSVSSRSLPKSPSTHSYIPAPPSIPAPPPIPVSQSIIAYPPINSGINSGIDSLRTINITISLDSSIKELLQLLVKQNTDIKNNSHDSYFVEESLNISRHRSRGFRMSR